MLLPAALGLAVGLILALTGAGGGILAVPLLMFGLDWNITQAAPVALLAVGTSAALGALIGLKQRVVRYRAAAMIAVIGVLITPLGVLLAHRVPTRPLTVAFAAVLIYVAVRTFLQALPRSPAADATQSAPCLTNPESKQLVWNQPCAGMLAGTGALTGLLTGLLGVGGGFVLVPALGRATNLPMQSIVTTSLAVIALVSAAAITSAWFAGKLDLSVSLPFVGGTLAGMLAGRMIAGALTGPRIQQGFALVAAGVAIGLLVRSFY